VVTQDALLIHAQVAQMEECAALFEQAQRSLDLQNGPLLRAVLVDGPQGQQRLVVVTHHMVVDGVSWRVLLDDVQTSYRQLSESLPVRLPAKTSAFRDWASRLQ
uniref:condensation domain-containing protein n=1 Tax=Pseudomonas viridiflava TaxID=33069 RepID=UPI0013CE95DA